MGLGDYLAKQKAEADRQREEAKEAARKWQEDKDREREVLRERMMNSPFLMSVFGSEEMPVWVFSRRVAEDDGKRRVILENDGMGVRWTVDGRVDELWSFGYTASGYATFADSLDKDGLLHEYDIRMIWAEVVQQKINEAIPGCRFSSDNGTNGTYSATGFYYQLPTPTKKLF